MSSNLLHNFLPFKICRMPESTLRWAIFFEIISNGFPNPSTEKSSASSAIEHVSVRSSITYSDSKHSQKDFSCKNPELINGSVSLFLLGLPYFFVLGTLVVSHVIHRATRMRSRVERRSYYIISFPVGESSQRSLLPFNALRRAAPARYPR